MKKKKEKTDVSDITFQPPGLPTLLKLIPVSCAGVSYFGDRPPQVNYHSELLNQGWAKAEL
jgi:hypothetical protein